MSRLCCALFATASCFASSAAAQETYKLPPKEVVDLLDAPTIPSVRPSPDAKWLLAVERPPMPSIADVARPWIGLAGLRIDPKAHALQEIGFDSGLTLRSLDGKSTRKLELPANARIAGVEWSHSSRALWIELRADDGVELWYCNVESAKPLRIATHVNTVFGAPTWLPDGERILVRLVPDSARETPPEPGVPAGPATMESRGKKSPIRTYQDLLNDEHDAQLLEHFAQTQLAIVDPRKNVTTPIGKPGEILDADWSPDGQHLLVRFLERPFSYVLPLDLFPRRLEIWDASGTLEQMFARFPLQDSIPIDGVATGPRNVSWNPNAPASLLWVEALDGGDPKAKVEQRDRWMTRSLPFKGEPTELLRTQYRARGLQWLADPSSVLVSEYDRDRRWQRVTLHDLTARARPDAVVEDRSVNDRYGNPGQIQSEVRANGTRVARMVGDFIFRAGEGDGPGGARPFFARQNLSTLAVERLWSASDNTYESVVAIESVSASATPRLITRRETASEPPNLRLQDLEAKTTLAITSYPDPQPAIRGIKKQLVTYKRPDGVELSATLYTPANYVSGTRLPLVIWAYPLEFNDASTAGQVSGSPHRFTQIRGLSHLTFLTQGYAVMDNATMPIVGDPETMNDTFIEQITAAAKAAIDKAAEMGVGDPARVGVGGHSYGAFMTANLLANTDLFRAGCARSGAYNRSLTPFGFQSERRTFWEAPEVYGKVSPFYQADKINEPLLMIHGEKDANPGTFPIQSERLYQAIAGLGGTVRLVVLPGESHGYSARESVLDTQAEMIAWFDRYVKPVPAVDAAAPVSAR
ncbi:MAG TPA: prolyl oligopeptidase family serine peptidase [Planctomycetota bacterium]|nr:prolyl oligopeptidase family serine peptidase [Planctomycetota bacterium]